MRPLQPADRSGAGAPCRTYRAIKEEARSGTAESADRPHPPEKPACRRSLRHCVGAGQLPGRFLHSHYLQRGVRRLGRVVGRRLSLTLKHQRLERSTALESLYPTHPGRSAFRIHKDQLKVRPIWHQREDRVQAHILVCFLAFVLWKSLEMWQQRAGLGNSPRTILEELAGIQSRRGKC
jgi:hypothetical protein